MNNYISFISVLSQYKTRSIFQDIQSGDNISRHSIFSVSMSPCAFTETHTMCKPLQLHITKQEALYFDTKTKAAFTKRHSLESPGNNRDTNTQLYP